MFLNHTPTLAGRPWLPDLVVNEANWHPIFQKCRWYNLKRRVVDGFPVNGRLNPGLPSDAIWTVDEPVIWAALGPCLEMASRVFVASLGLPFWDAILDAQPMTHIWQEKRGLGVGINDVPYKATDRDTGNQRSVEELSALFATYARYITFSFFPVPDDLSGKLNGTSSLSLLNVEHYLGRR